MKLRYALAIMALCICNAGFAQKARINLYAAYVFDDKFDSYYDNVSYYRGKVLGGLQFGGGVEYMLHPMQGIELLYLRQTTTAPVDYYLAGEQQTNFNLGLNYIMVASNRYFGKPGGKLEGYGGLMLGANVVSLKNPENNYSDTKTKFAWGLRLGGNIWASEKVAVKIQAQLLSSVQSAGGGLYFGTGGVSTGLTTYSSMFQFGLGGGVAFKVGH